MSKEAKKAAAAGAPAETTQEVSLLDQIVEEGRLARDPEAKDRGKGMVAEFVAQFLEGNMGLSRARFN
jgi:type VI secretion system protein ImpC